MGFMDGPSGKRIEQLDLRAAFVREVDLRDARSERVRLTGTRMRGVELDNVTIDGDIEDLVINGVEVAPLIDAELDRRYPDRAKMRPTDPDGYREAWDIARRLWAETVARASRLPPELLHEPVDGEWSFIETLRHLVFATDAWVGGRSWATRALGPAGPAARRDARSPAFRGTATPGRRWTRCSRCARTGWRRCAGCSASSPTNSSPQRPSRSPEPGYPPPESYPVSDCLLIVLNEEWEHRLYAERDLDAL